MRFTYVTCDPEQTRDLGKAWARETLLRRKRVWGLRGELGGGKTTFLQGFAAGLGIKDRVLSPTFVLMKRFEINHSSFDSFYHFDCYRINEEKEILELGFEKIISSPRNIIAIEWADRISKLLPPGVIIADFHFYNIEERSITIYGD